MFGFGEEARRVMDYCPSTSPAHISRTWETFFTFLCAPTPQEFGAIISLTLLDGVDIWKTKSLANAIFPSLLPASHWNQELTE